MVTLIVLDLIAVLTIAYLTYGRFFSRHPGLDDAPPAPACRINNGVDYFGARPGPPLGRRFSAIAVATPLVAVLVVGCAQTGDSGRDERIPAKESRSEVKADAKRVASRQSVRVFVIAGQSNAVGFNHIRQYHEGRDPFPETLRVQPRILFWPGSDTPQERENLWTTLRVGDSGAFGPEIAFCHDMEQAMPGATIGIVKYAVGGSGIARSVDYTDYIPAVAGYNDQGRNWHPPTDGRAAGDLYRALIANVRNAVSALDRDGRKWELTGFVWMQGEHEGGISRKMAEDYEKLLGDFIGSVRADLRAPSLPFAIGQVNSHTWVYGDIARKGQAEVCRKDRNALLVKTVDLPRVSGDAAHFTADGMLTLGSRFAEAMLTRVPAGRR